MGTVVLLDNELRLARFSSKTEHRRSLDDRLAFGINYFSIVLESFQKCVSVRGGLRKRVSLLLV